MSLRGVAARAAPTAVSTLIAAATWRGEIRIVLPLYAISTGRANAASTRRRAGSALSPPTRMLPTVTPAGITRVGAAAGVAVQARPAASVSAASVLSTEAKLNHFPRWLAGDLRRAAQSPASHPLAVRCSPYRRQPVASGTWQLEPCMYADVRALAAELSLDEVTAAVLVRRGYGASEDARRFLDGALPGHDPFALGDMREAVETIAAAVEAGARICVHGDYDADGICATALAVLLFRELNADVAWHLPSRFEEGYGLNDQTLTRLAAE